MGEALEKLKQRLSLLDYLRQQNWVLRPAGHGPEFVGLCPLQPETRPSFYIDECTRCGYRATVSYNSIGYSAGPSRNNSGCAGPDTSIEAIRLRATRTRA